MHNIRLHIARRDLNWIRRHEPNRATPALHRVTRMKQEQRAKKHGKHINTAGRFWLGYAAAVLTVIALAI